MSESFYLKPAGKYWAIWWGPTLICTVFSDEASAQHLCRFLDATRQMDNAGSDAGALIKAIDQQKEAWEAFRDARQAGRG